MPSGARNAESCSSLAWVRRKTVGASSRRARSAEAAASCHLEAHRGQGRRPLTSQSLVAHDPGPSLGPQSHRLGAVVAPEGEAELAQEDVDLPGVLGLDLHEVDRGGLPDVGQPSGLVDTTRGDPEVRDLVLQPGQ